jgi:murein DD-endopeptidase MepM/ murein hydrolase activator NlpD
LRRLLALTLALVLAGCGYIRVPHKPDRSASSGGGTRPAPARPAEAPPVASGDSLVVQRGDSLHAIARGYNVNLRELIELNQLQPPYRLQPGQRLALPRGGAVVAERYGTDEPMLTRAPAGGAPSSGRSGVVVAEALPPPEGTSPSPGGIRPTQILPPPTAEPMPAPALVPPPAESPQVALAPPIEPSRGGGQFLRPVEGPILSAFGPKPGGVHNDGINIQAPKGTPIRAAQRGTVVYAGNELRGFGNMILLRHDQGWVTAYAHGDVLLVQRGDTVERGQVIARVGSTGGVDQPQLHFELRRGTRPVDPTPHLGPSSPT